MEQENVKKSSLQSRDIALIAVSLLVLLFVAGLIWVNYSSSQQIRATMLKHLQLDAEKRADTVAFFFTGCGDDLKALANSRDVSVFFENQALGMSMRYGLRQSLIPIKDLFSKTSVSRLINGSPVYDRIILVTAEDEKILADSASKEDRIPESGFYGTFNKNELDLKKGAPYTGPRRLNGELIITEPYFFKGKYEALIIAWINKESIDKLIKEKGIHCNSFKLLDASSIKNLETPRGQVRLTAPVNGTPFVLEHLEDAKHIYGSVHPLYILSGFAAVGIFLFSLMLVMLHMNLQSKILKTQLDATSLREEEANAFNEKLKEEIKIRRSIEKSLRENEMNFHTFFESMADMSFVASNDSNIIFVNSAALKAMGYSKEELLNMRLVDLYPYDKHTEAMETFSSMLRKEKDQTSLPMRHKSGSLIPVETRVWPGKWNGERCIFATSKNLSHEQEAQQSFEHLFQNNPSLLVLFTKPGKNIVDVNNSFIKATGYTRDELIGKKFRELEIFREDKQDQLVNEMLEKDGHFTDLELPIFCKDGRRLVALFSMETIGSHGKEYFLAVILDITDRKTPECK